MPPRARPLFPRWSNTLLWAAIAGALLFAGAVPAAAMAWAHSPSATGRGHAPLQPVPFDHRHHVRDDGIPCLYCHGDATRSRYAGVPPTELCMGCHAQV